jgi:hypothetical protein
MMPYDDPDIRRNLTIGQMLNQTWLEHERRTT